MNLYERVVAAATPDDKNAALVREKKAALVFVETLFKTAERRIAVIRSSKDGRSWGKALSDAIERDNRIQDEIEKFNLWVSVADDGFFVSDRRVQKAAEKAHAKLVQWSKALWDRVQDSDDSMEMHFYSLMDMPDKRKIITTLKRALGRFK